MDIRQEVPLVNSRPLRRPKVKLDHDAWQAMDYLGTMGKGTILEEEMEFWQPFTLISASDVLSILSSFGFFSRVPHDTTWILHI
jgi:hypothetical protein